MSLNQCNFIGRLGVDPEVRSLPDGKAVVNINIACSEKWKDKQSGEMVEETEWVRASAFGRTAEIIAEYFHKGSLIYISGKMKTRKYQSQDGSDRYSTDIRIRDFDFIDKKSESTTPQAVADGKSQQEGVAQYKEVKQTQQQAPQDPADYEEYNDSMPF